MQRIQIIDGVTAFRRGKRWYVGFSHPERGRKRVSLRTSNTALALTRARELARDFSLGVFDPWSDKVHVPGLLEALRAYKKAQRASVSAATLQTYEDRIGGLSKHLGLSVRLSDVTPEDVSSYVWRTHLADATRYTRFQTMRAFFAWAVKEGYLKDNPCDEVKRPKKPGPVTDFLSRAQFRSLLAHIEEGGDEWLARFVKVAAFSGLRLGELCRLRWDDIGHGMIKVRTAKSDTTGDVPVGAELAAVLSEIPRTSEFVLTGAHGGPAYPNRVSRRFKAYCKRARLPERIRFHTLRHTYASWLSMGGVGIDKIKDALRHKRIETTLRYRHLDPESYANEVNSGLSRFLAHGPETDWGRIGPNIPKQIETERYN